MYISYYIDDFLVFFFFSFQLNSYTLHTVRHSLLSNSPVVVMALSLLQPTRTESSENNDSSHDTRRPIKFDVTIHLSNITKYFTGDPSCGAALCCLYRRCKEEKEFLLSHVRSEGGNLNSLVTENGRLSRQQLLLGDEGDFTSAAMAVGLAERQQEYKSDR